MSNDFIRAERPEKRRRRRHRYSESVKPASQASYIAAIVSGVSILYTLFIMVYSVVEAGEIGNVFGGVAFLCMLASIGFFLFCTVLCIVFVEGFFHLVIDDNFTLTLTIIQMFGHFFHSNYCFCFKTILLMNLIKR